MLRHLGWLPATASIAALTDNDLPQVEKTVPRMARTRSSTAHPARCPGGVKPYRWELREVSSASSNGAWV